MRQPIGCLIGLYASHMRRYHKRLTAGLNIKLNGLNHILG